MQNSLHVGVFAVIFCMGLLFQSPCYGQSEMARISGILANVYNSSKANDPMRDSDGTYNDMQTYLYWNKQTEEAWKRQDWEDAISAIKRELKYENNYSLDVATYYMALGMLYLNTKNKTEACKFLQNAIYVMRNSKNLGEGCEQRAVIFLQKVNSGFRTTFYHNDVYGEKILGYSGILGYIMEMPRARYFNYYEKEKARYGAMARYFDSMKSTYEAQGRVQASMAKFYAGQEYSEKTGRTFDPSSRPSYDSGAREEWDACKKIYDIFGD